MPTDSYKDYLASDHWKQLKSRARKRLRNLRCGVCYVAGVQLDFHHITYGTNLFDVSPKEIRAVCRDCHEAIHDAYDKGVLSFSTSPRLKRSISSRWGRMVAAARKGRGLTLETIRLQKKATKVKDLAII